MTTQYDSSVRKGFSVQPTDNGGVVVYPRDAERSYALPIAAFTTVEDFIAWLAGSYQAESIVISQQRFAEAIGASFNQGQATASTKQ
jgi:hypothetical protein